jgi:outer membrane protein insertion porin family
MYMIARSNSDTQLSGVQVGDVMSDEKATQAIKSLYNTGFFKDVRIEAEGQVLVVTVQERSAIAKIDFSCNKSFPSDKMTEGLKQIGISEGLIFDKSQLDRAEQEIKRQYLGDGGLDTSRCFQIDHVVKMAVSKRVFGNQR